LFEKRSTFLPLAALAINWCWLVAREATIIERMIVRARIVGLALIAFSFYASSITSRFATETSVIMAIEAYIPKGSVFFSKLAYSLFVFRFPASLLVARSMKHTSRNRIEDEK
jgi:hypothetical protein